MDRQISLIMDFGAFQFTIDVSYQQSLKDIAEALIKKGQQEGLQLIDYKFKELIFKDLIGNIFDPQTKIQDISNEKGKAYLLVQAKTQVPQYQAASQMSTIKFYQQSSFHIQEQQQIEVKNQLPYDQNKPHFPKTKSIHKQNKIKNRKAIKWHLPEKPNIQLQQQQESDQLLQTELLSKDLIIRQQLQKIEKLENEKNQFEKKFELLMQKCKKSEIKSDVKQIDWVSQILSQIDIKKSKRQFLIKTISKFEQAKIKNIKLKYRFDRKNPTNFHEYINGTHHLLILIQTPFYTCFGAYLSQKIQIQQEGGQAFLFSVNDQIFKKRSETPAHKYSLFSLIIGNNDLVIQPNKNRAIVSSKLFNKYSSFNDKNSRNFSTLLGLEINQISLEKFEIHQVLFEKKHK